MASYDSQAVATALGDRIRAYLADGRAPRFSFAPTPNYATPALLSCLAMLMVCVLMRNAFHQAGHLLLDIDRAHDELRVRRKLFGVPYGHQARFALAELSDLQLEHGPVLARFEQGLELLRAELGLYNGPDETANGHDSARTDPARYGAAKGRSCCATFTGSSATASSRRLAVAVAAVTVIGSVPLLLVSNANRGDGTLEIRAEYRCLFDGMEILPGGDMSAGLKPGRYEIRVFNSAAPGGWESQFYTLHAGQSLLVPCRPPRLRR